MIKIYLFIALILSTVSLKAQDRLFTYTYQSNVLNTGQKELEIWNTFRTGKADYFSRLDNRTEFEIGLGKNVQTSFYLNLSTQTKTIMDNSIKSFESENEISFSNEWKWKISDPVANPIGFALYGEYGIGNKEYDLEGKIILDKKFKQFTFAANGTFEYEFAPVFVNNELEWEKETKIDFNLSAAYTFSPKFHLTLENTFRNVLSKGELEHSALFSGIGVSFVQNNYWINFTVLPQIKSFKGETNSTLNLNEFEKYQFRLLFSYEL